MTTTMHEALQHPHEGGCHDCAQERRCNYCGLALARGLSGCTNGRCMTCHDGICAPAGATEPGHGFFRSGTHCQSCRLGDHVRCTREIVHLPGQPCQCACVQAAGHPKRRRATR